MVTDHFVYGNADRKSDTFLNFNSINLRFVNFSELCIKYNGTKLHVATKKRYSGIIK